MQLTIRNITNIIGYHIPTTHVCITHVTESKYVGDDVYVFTLEDRSIPYPSAQSIIVYRTIIIGQMIPIVKVMMSGKNGKNSFAVSRFNTIQELLGKIQRTFYP